MTLAAGTRLGLYEILSPLGAGGMGEVYKARDTRLGREVAVKVLPESLAADPERLTRFEREARVLASLNHPNIAAIYGVEDSTAIKALVLELVEGPTLQDRIESGAIPIDEALPIARQIAEALEAAHEKGIVHRDLKPANIKLDRDGKVKVLDFGLAKALDPVSSSSPDLSQSPTASIGTQAGTILGTAAYMSPEQARGRAADKRADIWAFGVVLFEMVTGRRLFEGETVSDTLAAVLRQQIPWDALPRETPGPVVRMLRRCLDRDPAQRLHDIADARLEINSDENAREEVATASPVLRGGRAAWVVAAAATVAAAGLAAVLFSRRAPSGQVLRASILPPDGTELVSTWIDAGPVEISPDGLHLVFTARKGEGPNMLWVRSLSDPSARLLAGTEGADRPFWSPDGRFIGFFANRSLKKIDVNGGTVFTLASANQSRGGSWNRDGVILFVPDSRGPVYRISADGGKAVPATPWGPNDASHRYPHFLPDSRHFLYLARHGSNVGPDAEPTIMVGSLDSPAVKPVVRVNSNAVCASGKLLYVREGALVSQAFDLGRLAVEGEPETVASDVLMDKRFSRGVFSASQNGILVYQTGRATGEAELRWFDRTGTLLGTVGAPADFFNGGDPEIAPDGKRAAVTIVDLRTGRADIWLVDLDSGTRSRFTTGQGDKVASAWTRDGRRLAYNVANPGTSGFDIVAKLVSGLGLEEKLVSDPREAEIPVGFTPDGRFFLHQSRKASQDDLIVMSLDGTRKSTPLIPVQADREEGQFSPDGRFVAFTSNESGRFDVYVAAFPASGSRWQVSQNGGVEPRWSRDGTELFFFAPDNRLMAARVRSGPDTFQVGAIEPLFQARILGTHFRYDVAPDGKRFLVTSALPHGLSPITIVANWTAELKSR